MAAFLALRMSAALARLPTAFLSAFFLSLSDGLRGGAGTGLGSLSLLTFFALANLLASLALAAAFLAALAAFFAAAIFLACLAALLAAFAAFFAFLAAFLAAAFPLTFFLLLSTSAKAYSS